MIVIRRVVGNSMLPTLRPGQVIIGLGGDHFLSRWYSPLLRPGRIVIVRHNGLEKIKRITELKKDQIYVLGDNPSASTDSRHFGWLFIEDVLAVIL